MDVEVQKKPKTKKQPKEAKITLSKYFKKVNDAYHIDPPKEMKNDELVEYLRKELDSLNLQARDIELKRTCVEEKLNQLKQQANKFFIYDQVDPSDCFVLQRPPIEYVNDFQYELDNLDLSLSFDQSNQINAPLRDHSLSKGKNDVFLIPGVQLQAQETTIKPEPMSLWKYFGYNSELQDNLQNIDNISNEEIAKIAEYFGMKSKITTKADVNRLKTSINEIASYCSNQRLPDKIHKLYKGGFIQSLEITN